jgi:hypothetical protein
VHRNPLCLLRPTRRGASKSFAQSTLNESVLIERSQLRENLADLLLTARDSHGR